MKLVTKSIKIFLDSEERFGWALGKRAMADVETTTAVVWPTWCYSTAQGKEVKKIIKFQPN